MKSHFDGPLFMIEAYQFYKLTIKAKWNEITNVKLIM